MINSAYRRKQTSPDCERANLKWTDVSRNFLPLSGSPLSFLRPHVGTFAKNPLHSRWSSPCIPSERGQARAHTSRSKPIQKAPSALAPLRARSSSSAAQIWRLNSAHMGDKCAVWHRRDVRPTRRTRFGASLRCSPDSLLQPDWGEATSPRGGAAGNALLSVPNVHPHVWRYICESERKGHEHGLSGKISHFYLQ